MIVKKKLMALAIGAAAAAVFPVQAASASPAAVSPPWPGIAVFVRGSSLTPGAEVFRTVYGSGFVYGGEFRLRIAGRFSVSLEAERFKKNGKMTVTGEPTTMAMTPLSAMALCRFLDGDIRPYIGAGVSSISYRETNHLGAATGSGIGWAAAGGVTARWKFLGFDARVKYFSVKAETEAEKVDFGGLTVGLGLGVFF